MLAGHLHAPAAFVHRVVPVQVVHLQLHEFHLRVIGEQRIQGVGAVVHREADVADLARGFLLGHEIPHAVLVEHGRARVAHVMQQVEVDVVGAQARKRGVQACLRCLGVGQRPGQAFRGQRIAFARVPFHQGLAQRDLGSALVVHVGGVEVGAARFQERIHHLAELRDVDALHVIRVGKRQAHASESELRDVFEISHRCLLLFPNWHYLMLASDNYHAFPAPTKCDLGF